MQESNTTGVELLAGRKQVRECLEQAPERVDAVWLQQGLKGRELSQIMQACKKAGLRYQLATQQKMDAMFKGRHQGALARILPQGFVEETELFALAHEARLPLVVALDQVQDPGNVGVLARTMLGLGAAGIMLPKHNAAGLGPGAVRSAAGALWKLPLCKVTNLGRSLETARETGLSIYGAALGEDSVSYHAFAPRFPAVLVLGGEEKGLRQSIRSRCDALVAIPLSGQMESLNVAQAGAVLLGHWLAKHLC